MRIQVLGCSGGVGPGLRTTSLLINGNTLLDAGTGVGDLSISQMREISSVYLTHSHLDHVCGLAFMADNLCGELQRPLRVRASQETLRALQRHLFNGQIWPDFTVLPSLQQPTMNFSPMAVGQPEAVGAQLQISAFAVRHTVPAVGYLLESSRAAFAFTGDTGLHEGMWGFLNARPQLDKLIVEAAFSDDEREPAEASQHLTPQLLAQSLQSLRHRPELLLTHAKPGSERSIEQQCHDALAGWRFRLLRRGDVIDL